MLRKLLLAAILLVSFTTAEAHRAIKIKKDTIPLKITEKSFQLKLSDGNINWVSSAVLNGKVCLFYGSNDVDSVIYLNMTTPRFQGLMKDTIDNAKWFRSTPNSCAMPVLYKGREKLPVFIYSYNAPFKNYIADKYLNLNNSTKNINDFFVPDNRIIKIIQDDYGTIRAFYIDERFDKGVVMCISSKDMGVTWTYPEICIADNMISFRNCSMAVDRTGTLYAVITDDMNRAFVCKSSDYGMTWSYPVRLSYRLKGSGHSLTINRSGVYILYRSLRKDETNGDYVVWNGSIKEFASGAHDGQKVVVTERPMVESYNVSNMQIEHMRGNKYLIYGIIDNDGRRTINAYLFKGRFYL